MMRMTRNGVDGYEEKGLGIWDDADPVATINKGWKNVTNMNDKKMAMEKLTRMQKNQTDLALFDLDVEI